MRNDDPRPIISISRRTDIPAFYAPWLKRRLEEGWVEYVHPYSRKRFQVSLKAAHVAALVFWSKNFGPFFQVLPLLKAHSIPFYCLYTITGLPSALEGKVPPLEASLSSFRKLAEETSPDRIQWRYDPIILSPALTVDYHRKRFDSIASQLSGFTRRCIVSFVNRYKKIQGRLEKSGFRLMDPPVEEKFFLLRELMKIGKRYEIDLYYCCDEGMLASGIKKARCVDPEILSKHCGVDISRMVFSPTRKDCGCLKSLDIGFYDTCPHGCVYCYANSRVNLVEKNWARHDPASSSLLVCEEDDGWESRERKNGQMELFEG